MADEYIEEFEEEKVCNKIIRWNAYEGDAGQCDVERVYDNGHLRFRIAHIKYDILTVFDKKNLTNGFRYIQKELVLPWHSLKMYIYIYII